MAISNDQNVLNVLKVFYKDKVESLIERDSPVAKMFKKIRVEGKEARFSAIAGRGSATSADATVATAAAANGGSKNEEFKVTPGQVFSVYTVNAKELKHLHQTKVHICIWQQTNFMVQLLLLDSRWVLHSMVTLLVHFVLHQLLHLLQTQQ